MKCCRICNSEKIEVFFSKPNTCFWHGEENEFFKNEIQPKKLSIDIYYCSNCCHIGSIISENLKKLLNIYYTSKTSSPSTTHGEESKYSRTLTKRFFDIYDRMCGSWTPKRVLEIGCQSGYLLYKFMKRGSKEVLGIEPGEVPPYKGNNGYTVNIKRGFLSDIFFKEDRFDFIYALQVLEHIEYPLEFISLISNLLKKNGKVLLSVPNEEFSLRSGNIGMIHHQHLNYFTKYTLGYMLAQKGLFVKRSISKPNQMLYVLAEKMEMVKCYKIKEKEKIELQKLKDKYNVLVDKKLNKIENIIGNGRSKVGLYGANCSISNIFSWSPSIPIEKIKIFDSDSKKWGKQFSGYPNIVETFESLNSVDDIIIIPFRLQNEIYEYLRRKLVSNSKIHRLYS